MKKFALPPSQIEISDFGAFSQNIKAYNLALGQASSVGIRYSYVQGIISAILLQGNSLLSGSFLRCR